MIRPRDGITAHRTRVAKQRTAKQAIKGYGILRGVSRCQGPQSLVVVPRIVDSSNKGLQRRPQADPMGI